MGTFREQIQEIVNSDLTKARKKQKLKDLGLTSSDISQLLFDHEAAKKAAAKEAENPSTDEAAVKERQEPSTNKVAAKKAPKTSTKKATTKKDKDPSKVEATAKETKKPSTDKVAPQPTEESGSFFVHYDEPNKDNTLYLTIKQVYFDEIVAGTKKEEYREIKDTTYRKYLQCNQSGAPLYDANLIAADDPYLGDPMVWNGGEYPYAPRLYQYLNLAVGYAKERDTALVKVTGYSFFPAQDKYGRDARFDDDGEHLVRDDNGPLCLWVLAYHLGEVVELHRKGR